MEIPPEIIGPIIGYLIETAKTSISDGAKSFAEDTGKRMWELIKRRFQTDKQRDMVKKLENQPDDLSLQLQFTGELKELFLKDSDLAKELEEIVQENRQIIKGDSNISFQNVNGSNITINR